MSKDRKTVFVGMSGGVDSSVSAALLRDAGYDVVGVFIKVWQADFLPCTWREDRRDAMRAAAHLGIPFLTLDLEEEYKREVVDYMIQEYAAGRVPNPDVMCNTHVKFGAFLDFARRNGADAVATGHYARVQPSAASHQSLKGNDTGNDKMSYTLLRGVDPAKDQSYFLWTLTQKELAHIIFPVGHLRKSAVRDLAKSYGLPNAAKKDSQGLCFIGKVDMAEFLRHYLKTEEGDVYDQSGAVVGRHDGALLYAIGQRHGVRYTDGHGDAGIRVIVGKDIVKNTLIVAERDNDTPEGSITEVTLSGLNCIPCDDSVLFGPEVTASYRYHGDVLPVRIHRDAEGIIRAQFDPVRTCAQILVSPGQSLVFYENDECLGGAVVEKVLS